MKPVQDRARLIEGVVTDATLQGADMDTLVISTLLIQGIAIMASAILLEAISCRPQRRPVRDWVVAHPDATVRDNAAAQTGESRNAATDLPRAA
jgi:hypothetical protein